MRVLMLLVLKTYFKDMKINNWEHNNIGFGIDSWPVDWSIGLTTERSLRSLEDGRLHCIYDVRLHSIYDVKQTCMILTELKIA